jgi:UDP-glucose 6-dehydrogenase
MTNKELSLEEIKSLYKEFEEKYSLPSFEELNENFQIEKVIESETDYLLRELRKHIAEKLYNYLRFAETLLNPVNASFFILSLAKSINPEKKKKLEEIYKKLAKNEIKCFKVDLTYSEEKEAEFIKDSSNLWEKIKRDFLEIIEDTEKNLDNKFEKTRGYFG